MNCSRTLPELNPGGHITSSSGVTSKGEMRLGAARTIRIAPGCHKDIRQVHCVPQGQNILALRHTRVGTAPGLAGGRGRGDRLFLVDGRACLAAAEPATDRGEVPDCAGRLEAQGVPEDYVP